MFAVALWLLSGSVTALAADIPGEVDDAQEIGRDIKDLLPGGVSAQTKQKLKIIDGIKDEVDLESPPWDDEDTPQVAKTALDQLDRKYEEARSALRAISSTDQGAKRVKKATKFVDEFEMALTSWTELLEARDAEAAPDED
jgi:hypothetical protein